MNQIRIGIIGAGKIASFFHLPILKSINDVEIAYVADVRDPRILARAYHTQAVTISGDPGGLPDCDIVLLAIPVAVREPYIREFARGGTYIFSEKPFAPTVELHQSWLSMTDRITCNYHRVHYSSIGQMKRLTQSGILGELREVKISEGGIIGKTGKGTESYQNDPKLSGGGIVIEWGCHTISQMTYLFDEYHSRLVHADVEYQDGFDVDLHARWKIKTGEHTFPLTYDLSVVRPLETRAEFSFDCAKVIFDHTKPDSLLRIAEAKTKGGRAQHEFLLQPDPSDVTSNYQAFYMKWRNLIDKAQAGIELDSPRETSLATSQWISDIYAATRQASNGGGA